MRVEEGLQAVGLISMSADGISRWLLVVGASAMRDAQDFASEGKDLFFDGKRIKGMPVCTQKFVLQDLQIRVEYDMTALE